MCGGKFDLRQLLLNVDGRAGLKVQKRPAAPGVASGIGASCRKLRLFRLLDASVAASEITSSESCSQARSSDGPKTQPPASWKRLKLPNGSTESSVLRHWRKSQALRAQPSKEVSRGCQPRSTPPPRAR